MEEIPLFFHQFDIHTDNGDDSQAADDVSLKGGGVFMVSTFDWLLTKRAIMQMRPAPYIIITIPVVFVIVIIIKSKKEYQVIC